MTTTINGQRLDMEPAIATMLGAAQRLRDLPPYKVKTLQQVKQSLDQFLANTGLDGARASGLKRMGGGASKEQFIFDLEQNNQPACRCVLRMDPLESAVVTSREREYAILEAMQGVVPAPKPMFCDSDGSQLGRPALITDFVPGVTKPTASSSNVSGFGTVFNQATREKLAVPFMQHFAAMHGVDWRLHQSGCFQAPSGDPEQAARWQVNWWTNVWQGDVSEGYPLMGLTERWLRDNLPTCEESDLVFVHSDYRTGNYLYDESSCDITAILDWELVHIGDFHEDLAWAAIRSWSTVENGTLLASGLMPVAELCDRYNTLTGRRVDRKTLYFYQVLGLYKCVAICLATSVNAARHAHNHQDVLLSWLATAGYAFLTDLCTLLERGNAE
ncbi:MAG: phosphotransferase family protein [Gammaproteobacteria bacterium]|nr:phosphotransferase family protein [Gammaproteobacteria bacterium]